MVWKSVHSSEQCTISDVDINTGTVKLSFNMFDKGYITSTSHLEVVENCLLQSQDIRFRNDTLSDYWIYGVCYTLAMIFSNNALKHVTYPTQVLAKSCKMIPVLLAGTLFGSTWI